jgi:two-component system sensor histidine kinase KdpD
MRRAAIRRASIVWRNISISHVVFGQSARSRLDILLRGSVIIRFLAEVRDVTVQVVPMQRERREAK